MKTILQFLAAVLLFFLIWNLITPTYTQVSKRFFRNSKGDVFIRKSFEEVSTNFFDGESRSIAHNYLKIYKIDIETYRQIGPNGSNRRDFSMGIDTNHVYKDYNCYNYANTRDRCW